MTVRHVTPTVRTIENNCTTAAFYRPVTPTDTADVHERPMMKRHLSQVQTDNDQF